MVVCLHNRIVSTSRAARWPQTELPIAITPSAVVVAMVVGPVQATLATCLARTHFTTSPPRRSVEETTPRSPA